MAWETYSKLHFSQACNFQIFILCLKIKILKQNNYISMYFNEQLHMYLCSESLSLLHQTFCSILKTKFQFYNWHIKHQHNNQPLDHQHHDNHHHCQHHLYHLYTMTTTIQHHLHHSIFPWFRRFANQLTTSQLFSLLYNRTFPPNIPVL